MISMCILVQKTLSHKKHKPQKADTKNQNEHKQLFNTRWVLLIYIEVKHSQRIVGKS